MIWGKHDYFFPLLFPRTQGSRLLQEGRALPRHASLEGFLQATSRLFGCHWDCLKRICFCTVLQGAPHQEKVDHPWALDTAVMHLSILRLRGWASVCKLGCLAPSLASNVSWPLTWHVTHSSPLFWLIAAFNLSSSLFTYLIVPQMLNS